jgi:ribosome-associated protein
MATGQPDAAMSVDELLKSGELDFEFYRSSGPGGQNVNKVSTAVRLRWDLRQSRLIPEDVKARLRRLAGRRITEEGTLIIEAQRFRTQEQNRQDAVERLVKWIAKVWEKPRRRIPTKPSAGSEMRRLESKRRRSITKGERKRDRDLDE